MQYTTEASKLHARTAPAIDPQQKKGENKRMENKELAKKRDQEPAERGGDRPACTHAPARVEEEDHRFSARSTSGYKNTKGLVHTLASANGAGHGDCTPFPECPTYPQSQDRPVGEEEDIHI